MDRSEVGGFLRFLHEATEEEILAKQERMFALLRKVDRRGVAAQDIRFCLRLVDQELVARNEILFHKQG